MKPNKPTSQGDLFKPLLEDIIDLRHPLCEAANRIDWKLLEERLGEFYSDRMGAPGKPTRLMVGLHYLKHTYDHSDESVVATFVENPYWQYFCGYKFFQHDFPIDPSSMTRWRQRIGEAGVAEMFKAVLAAAQRSGFLDAKDFKRVSVDTTVQEKAIAFPTDARLYYKLRELLVDAAKERGIKLRQSYSRVGKRSLILHGRRMHARQYGLARKFRKQLYTQLGAVMRDIRRKVPDPDEALAHLLSLGDRLRAQQKDSKNKLYSLHAPEVECIGKGKARKRYEFGCKVGLICSINAGWLLGALRFVGNPYDGHTLSDSLKHMKEMTGALPEDVLLDKGYKGHDYKGDVRTHIVSSKVLKKATRWTRNWMRRRTLIEPLIGHTKSDHRMGRNYLKGSQGDQINALLAASAFNLRKLLRAFFGQIWAWITAVFITQGRTCYPLKAQAA